jgi:hypothetical protein
MAVFGFIWLIYLSYKIIKTSNDVEIIKKYLERNEQKVYQVIEKLNSK